MRPLWGARRRDSLAMRESGTSAVLPAATAPNGPGQLMSTCSTAMTNAMALDENHSDGEPLQTLPIVPDGTCVAEPSRGSTATTAAMDQLIPPPRMESACLSITRDTPVASAAT